MWENSPQKPLLATRTLYPGLLRFEYYTLSIGRKVGAFVQRSVPLNPRTSNPVGPTLGSVRITMGTWHQYPHMPPEQGIIFQGDYSTFAWPCPTSKASSSLD